MDKNEARTSLIKGLRIGGQSGTYLKQKITKTKESINVKRERVLPFETFEEFPLAYAYSQKYLTLEYREDYFEQLIDEYYLFLEKKYIYRTVCYLPNLILETPVDLPAGLKLMSVDENYLNYLISEDPFHSFGATSYRPLRQHFDPFDATIIVHEQVGGDINDRDLRLGLENTLKSMIISNGVSSSFEIRPAYTFSYFRTNSSTMFFPDLAIHSKPDIPRRVKLNSTGEISLFFDLLDKMENMPLAVKRYISAFTKASKDDKIIDLVIALESLYPSVKSENTYRISILTALALGEGVAMYKKVKDLYDYRSGIVHGNNQKPKITLDEATIIVKKTLRFYLEELAMGKKLEEVEEELTQQIFGGKVAISTDFFK